MFLGLKPLVVVTIVAVVLLLRWRKAGTLTWAFAWWLAMYVGLRFGFVTPIPASVITLYMAIVTGSILAYVSSSRERWTACTSPILRLVLEPRYKLLLVLILLAVPLLAAFNVYQKMTVPVQAPAFGRTVHPAPPEEITVHETPINMITADNPYRHLEEDSPAEFENHLANGRRIYFENCFYCHGDAMAGDGMFAHGLNPIPSNFTDSGVLPILQESFLMWRIAKGGPGMPEEGGPWDSAMPAWESFLTEEELWDVILFLYDYTDYRPRAQEVHE